MGPPPRGVSSDDRRHVQAAEAEIRAKSRAEAASLIHRGFDEVVDIFNVVTDPVASVMLVSFTVPQGMVAKFDKFAIVFSDPIAAQSAAVNWRIVVNGSEIPHIQSLWAAWGNAFGVYGDLHDPFEIAPIWVQSGQVIGIEIVIGVGGWADAVVIAGRISGRLYKPASPSLIPEGGH